MVLPNDSRKQPGVLASQAALIITNLGFSARVPSRRSRVGCNFGKADFHLGFTNMSDGKPVSPSLLDQG